MHTTHLDPRCACSSRVGGGGGRGKGTTNIVPAQHTYNLAAAVELDEEALVEVLWE